MAARTTRNARKLLETLMPLWPLYIVASALLLGAIKRCEPRHPRSIHYRNPKARQDI